jgi:hypothetical protein
MAPPTVVAVGAVDSATPWAPGLPAGWQVDDILLIIVESTGGETAPSATGYAHVTGSPVVEATNTQLSVLWKRATTSEPAPTVTGPTDHAVTRMLGVRGCPVTGNPWNISPVATEATVDTSATWPGGTTTVADCLVLEIIAAGLPDAASTINLGVLANANYTGITERMDNWVLTGNGGGIGVVSGVKATAGATGQSTATLAVASSKALMTLALKPQVLVAANLYQSFPPIDRAASW